MTSCSCHSLQHMLKSKLKRTRYLLLEKSHMITACLHHESTATHPLLTLHSFWLKLRKQDIFKPLHSYKGLIVGLTLYPPMSGLSLGLVKRVMAPHTGTKRKRKFIQKAGRISDPYLPDRQEWTLLSACPQTFV